MVQGELKIIPKPLRPLVLGTVSEAIVNRSAAAMLHLFTYWMEGFQPEGLEPAVLFEEIPEELSGE